jgi:hypothetical protein
MGGENLWAILASVLSSLGVVGTFLIFVGKRMIAEHAVSRAEYDEDQNRLRTDIEEIRRFDGRLNTIETKVDGLQTAVTQHSKRSEDQLTGAMGHVRDRIDDLKDLIEARVGRTP